MVKIGIIGTGVGLRTYLPIFRRIEGAEVLAVAGSSDERTRWFAESQNISLAMDASSLCRHPDIDLVCVTSPTPYHRDQAMEALLAGKHVLCEKPLALDMRGTRELIEVAGSRPSQLAIVNHQLRFSPYIREARDLVGAGALGRIYYLHMHQQSTGFSDRQTPWTWSFDARQGGGVRLAMGSHQLDLLRYWFGESVATVQGSMDPVVEERVGSDGSLTPVYASGFYSAALQMESGLTAHISATAASCGVPGFEFSLFGDEGELHFDMARGLRVAFRKARGALQNVEVPRAKNWKSGAGASIFFESFSFFASALVPAIETGDWCELEPAARFSDAEGTQRLLDELAIAANAGTQRQLSERHRRGCYV